MELASHSSFEEERMRIVRLFLYAQLGLLALGSPLRNAQAGAPEPPERWKDKIRLLCQKDAHIECQNATLVKRPKNPADPNPFAPNIEFLGDCGCPGITNVAHCQQHPETDLTEAQTCNPDYASPKVISGNLIVVADDDVTDPNGDPTHSLGKALTLVFETQLKGRTVFFAETYQNSTPEAGCETNPAQCAPELPGWVQHLSQVDEHRLRCYTNNRYIPPPRRDFVCTEPQPKSFDSPPPADCPPPADPREEKNEGFADDNFVLLQPDGPIAAGLCKVFQIPNSVCQNSLAIISPTSEVELEKQCFPPDTGDARLPYLGKGVLFNSVVVRFAKKAAP